ncbi:MAG TPA: TraR/DksA C4-type zinc finger protein [Candidatus Methylacidiphilales bacterium]
MPKKISPKTPAKAAAPAPKKEKAPAKASKPAPASAKPVAAAPASERASDRASKLPPPPNGNGLRPAPAKLPEETSRKHLTPDFLAQQKQRLIELRDHLLNQMQGVAQDTLRVRAEGSEASAFGMHQADAGSDAYDKDFALSLLSQEQDALYEIEEALKRVEGNNYGVCEMSNKVIPKVRLEAIPHARFTVECQAQLERENKGRRRWDTIPQFMDSAENLVDEEDDASEEDDRRKEKD